MKGAPRRRPRAAHQTQANQQAACCDVSANHRPCPRRRMGSQGRDRREDGLRAPRVWLRRGHRAPERLRLARCTARHSPEEREPRRVRRCTRRTQRQHTGHMTSLATARQQATERRQATSADSPERGVRAVRRNLRTPRPGPADLAPSTGRVYGCLMDEDEPRPCARAWYRRPDGAGASVCQGPSCRRE